MQNPIDNIMKTTMENLKQMVDVDTVVGSAVDTLDGTTIIPVSKVSFGFVAGGGEYCPEKAKQKDSGDAAAKPFAGGAGAGVSVSPTGFLVVGGGSVRMVCAQVPSYIDRMIESVPGVIAEIKKALGSCGQSASSNEGKDDPSGGNAAPEDYVL